jgi:hypothetical protein
MNTNNSETQSSCSHLPMLKAVLKLYEPKYILELGIGLISTPLLSQYNYQGIENDRRWIERFPGLNVMYHDVGDIGNYTRLSELSEEQKMRIVLYYWKLNIPQLHPNLLFVDNYSACRSLAISTLKYAFDVIVFHDCETKTFEINGYDKVNMAGFNVRYLRTSTNWTGIMCREDKGIADAIKSFIDEFNIEYPDAKMSI